MQTSMTKIMLWYQAEMGPSCADPQCGVMVVGPAANSSLHQPGLGVGQVGCHEIQGLLKLPGAPGQLPGLVA